jgi:hypothetical protein
LTIEVHWSALAREMPRLKSGASLAHHMRRMGYSIQEEGGKTVVELFGRWNKLVFGSTGP